MKPTIYTSLVFTILFAGVINTITAQGQDLNMSKEELEKTILYHDSVFWHAYNNCDMTIMRKYLTDDLEFYHDKGGVMQTGDKVIEITKNNLCNNENFRLHREAVKSSLHVFPMKNIGAMLTGEHTFYVVEGTKERLDGISKFTHLWVFQNNVWKMSRIFSYDHKSAANLEKKEVQLSEKQLSQFVGTYDGNQTKDIWITRSQNYLEIKAAEFKGNIIPDSENTFYFPDRNLTFEFVTGPKEKAVKLIVRENGHVVEEAAKRK
jgi:hypothetical protein